MYQCWGQCEDGGASNKKGPFTNFQRLNASKLSFRAQTWHETCLQNNLDFPGSQRFACRLGAAVRKLLAAASGHFHFSFCHAAALSPSVRNLVERCSRSAFSITSFMSSSSQSFNSIFNLTSCHFSQIFKKLL